jgi:uncharacterized protein (DUF58 family)
VARSRVVQTPRGWGLLAGGLFALAIGYLALNLLLLLVGVVAVAFVGADLVVFATVTRHFTPNDFAVQRSENSALLAVGTVGTMAVRVECRRRMGFYAEVYDRLPEGFLPLAGSPHLLTWWEPGTSKSLAYAYRTGQRGASEIGPTIVVAHDTFGLAFRVAVVENRWPVEVVPQVALWKTEITVRLRNELVGRVMTRPRGFGTEFRSLREYQESDDFRSIVWKRSTFERLLVKETEVENRVDVALLVDVTRPMGRGVPGSEALDLAVDAALLVSRYAFSQGDRVAVLLFTDRPVAFLPLARTADHSFNVDRVLGEARVEPGAFQLEAAIRFLGDRLRQPSAVFAFTALDPPADLYGRGLSHFRAAGHRLFTFVPDPLRIFPPLPDSLAERTVRFAAGPEVARRERAVGRLRGTGVPVATYGHSDLFGQVTARYVRLRVGGGDL